MGNKESKSKKSDWCISLLFVLILSAFAFVGTAVNLQKSGTYSSWIDLFRNFDLTTFFFSQPALVYFGGIGVVLGYMFIIKSKG